MTARQEAKVTHHFNESEERVFDAFLDPASVRGWMGRHVDGFVPGVIERVEIDAHEGGKFHFAEQRAGAQVEAWGSYKAMERPHKLSFSWIVDKAEEAEPALVTIIILPHPDGGSVVTLTHETDGQGADRLEQTELAWNTRLRQIEALLDAGQV